MHEYIAAAKWHISCQLHLQNLKIRNNTLQMAAFKFHTNEQEFWLV